jgi:hypothetical protein
LPQAAYEPGDRLGGPKAVRGVCNRAALVVGAFKRLEGGGAAMVGACILSEPANSVRFDRRCHDAGGGDCMLHFSVRRLAVGPGSRGQGFASLMLAETVRHLAKCGVAVSLCAPHVDPGRFRYVPGPGRASTPLFVPHHPAVTVSNGNRETRGVPGSGDYPAVWMSAMPVHTAGGGCLQFRSTT